MSRIYQYPVVTEISNDDYLALGSAVNGSRSILASDLAPVIGNKTITERGTYKASDDSMDGYGQVTVDIPYTDIHVASGDIATFEGEDLPLKSLKVSIEPQQDLHGYDAPWAGGAGKNKFDISRVSNYEDPGSHATVVNNGNGTITVTATTSTNVSCGKNLGEIADLTVGEKYRLTATTTGSLNYIFLHGSNALWYFNGQELTITQEMLDGRVSFYASGANTSATISNLMIRPTNTDATFAPYSNICPIIGWDEAVVTRCGKNLIPSITEGVELASQTGTTKPNVDWYVTDYSRVEYGKTYYVSGTSSTTVCYYDRYKNFTRNTLSQRTITPQEGECYVRVNSLISGYAEPQIEEGNEATSFSPFGATYTIDLDGTRYGSEVDVVNGSGTDNRANLSLNSIDAFSSDAVNDNGYIRYNCGIVGKAQNFNILCDKIKVIQSTVQANANEELISGNANNNKLYFTIDSTRLSGDLSTSTGRSNALKTYLATNDIQVVYELATPITVQLSPTQVKSLVGENNIFADCGAVDVEYQTVWVRPSN